MALNFLELHKEQQDEYDRAFEAGRKEGAKGAQALLTDLRHRAAEIALSHGSPIAAGKIRSLNLIKRTRG